MNTNFSFTTVSLTLGLLHWPVRYFVRDSFYGRLTHTILAQVTYEALRTCNVTKGPSSSTDLILGMACYCIARASRSLFSLMTSTAAKSLITTKKIEENDVVSTLVFILDTGMFFCQAFALSSSDFFSTFVYGAHAAIRSSK